MGPEQVPAFPPEAARMESSADELLPLERLLNMSLLLALLPPSMGTLPLKHSNAACLACAWWQAMLLGPPTPSLFTGSTRPPLACSTSKQYLFTICPQGIQTMLLIAMSPGRQGYLSQGVQG